MKNGYKVGIFSEGTTKRTAGREFGTFDNAFLHLAKRNNSWVQPITLFWTEGMRIKEKAIVNFGKPFQIKDMSIDEGMKYFMEIQEEGLKENMSVARQVKLYGKVV